MKKPDSKKLAPGTAGIPPAGAAGPAGSISVEFPLHTTTPENQRGTWAKARIAREQKLATMQALCSCRALIWLAGSPGKSAFVAHAEKCTCERPPFPWDVVLTRIAPRPLDQGNDAASWKHVQDAIACWCGVDDRDAARVRYLYRQEKAPGDVRVRIEIATREAAVPARLSVLMAEGCALSTPLRADGSFVCRECKDPIACLRKAAGR